VVGPSLGQEAIDNGTNSAIVGLLLVSLWMMVYYGKAGWYANIALAVNLLFLWNFGKFRCSSYIAWYSRYRFDDGYSSVDANIIIYERAKEELRWKIIR
jgi:SecD/SecF fusion protein